MTSDFEGVAWGFVGQVCNLSGPVKRSPRQVANLSYGRWLKCYAHERNKIDNESIGAICFGERNSPDLIYSIQWSSCLRDAIARS